MRRAQNDSRRDESSGTDRTLRLIIEQHNGRVFRIADFTTIGDFDFATIGRRHTARTGKTNNSKGYCTSDDHADFFHSPFPSHQNLSQQALRKQ
jgi:hypothetical protein